MKRLWHYLVSILRDDRAIQHGRPGRIYGPDRCNNGHPVVGGYHPPKVNGYYCGQSDCHWYVGNYLP